MSIEKDQVQLLIDECRHGVSGKGPAIEVANDLLNSCCDNLDALLVERDQLKAEVEALRKDAERYRWLRQYTVDSYGAQGSFAALDRDIDASRNKVKRV